MVRDFGNQSVGTNHLRCHKAVTQEDKRKEKEDGGWRTKKRNESPMGHGEAAILGNGDWLPIKLDVFEFGRKGSVLMMIEHREAYAFYDISCTLYRRTEG